MKKLLRELLEIAQGYKKYVFFSNTNITTWFLTAFLSISGVSVYAQGPGSLFVDAGPDVMADCETGSVEITADFLEIYETISQTYTVGSIPYNPPFAFNGLANSLNPDADDEWSIVENLPFDFCFFGNLETQFQVGSNGVLRFDVDPGDMSNGWQFSADLPNNTQDALSEANVFTPVHDIDPCVFDIAIPGCSSNSEEIGYEVLGTYPNRVLVVSYYEVPLYSVSCNNLLATHMAVFYEFSNVIEIYIQDKPVCPSWNDGNAALGIQNNAGTVAYVPPGRNTSDSPWTTNNEAWRFAPSGVETYVFEWLDSDGNFISNNPTITVTPVQQFETYTARITYTNDCNGDVIVLTDEAIVERCQAEPDCLGEDFVEDFATGEGRFETPYTNLNFQPVGEVGGGDYAVSNTSAGMNGGWHVTTDHTGNTNGMMFVVNPEFFGDELYRRTITVTPNVDYSLNYWMTTMYDIDTAICSNGGDPSNITLRVEDVDGNLIAESSTGDVPNSSEPNWIEYGVNFNSADNTEIQFIFINNASGAMGCGNDLAIDDISLYYEGDLPVVVTPEDMEQCDVSGTTSTFDLITQIPIILDGQDPADFNITFHLSEVDASNNASAIANPNAYVNTTNPETIFVRIERADLPTCFAIVDFDLIVTQGFEITTNLPESVALCEGDEFPPLDATPTDPNLDLDLMTYEWYFDGNLISEEAILIPDQAGVYTVILVYDGCSTSTVEIEVIVQERPLLDLGEDQTLCDGDSFEIIPIVTGVSDDATYLWNTGANTETLTVNSSGTYTLEITDGPCVISDSIVVTFGEFPDVELGEDIRSCPGETQIITATTSHPEATFAWYENDVLMQDETGSSIQIVVSEEIVNTSVTYRVEVNSNGCISTDEITVHAYENNPNCIISQGLSPDDTPGYNDFLDLTFLAQRTGVTNLQIMNRHGRLVYEKNNYVNEWAGQSKEGELLPTGTYYYVINLSGSDPVYGNQITGWIYVNRK